MNADRFLILETSDRVGQVAVAAGHDFLAVRRLDETRRHARDLAPATRDLLASQCWKARDLAAVLVSRGPGSYTGLRVGVMSAKVLAYATGCAAIAVDTFAAIAFQATGDWARLDVLADAQQDKVYVQSFARVASTWQPQTALAIRPFAAWLADRHADAAVTGPGLRKWSERLPINVPVVDPQRWEAQAESVFHLGLTRFNAGQRDDPFTLEPLYLRPSSAEQQWPPRPPAPPPQ